jgi:hypothetical protein
MADVRPHAERRPRRPGVSAIARYLKQLDRELRIRRAPRERLLSEADDHLRASAEEIAASGVDAQAAEHEAVARFGAAALVARSFANAVATTSTRIALVFAATACACYAAAAALFVLTAPSWLRDFPQGAPSMLALQVATVALFVTGVRALRIRSALLVDELRLRYVANSVVIASLAVALAAGAELVLALTRPAPAPWSDASAIIAVYAVAAVVAGAASLVALAAAARTAVLAALPRPGGDLPSASADLIDAVAVAAPPLLPLAIVLRSRPALVCGVTAALAFAGTTAFAVADDGSGLVGAAATGLFEAAGVVFAYLTLGRALGLRGRTRGVARCS